MAKVEKKQIEVGDVFTKLTVVEQISKAKWICNCECGNSLTTYASKLLVGGIKSCGCLMKEVLVKRNTTHGLSTMPEYKVWKGMKKRCFNQNDKRFNTYAGRGISVHPDFVESYEKWLAEVGERPQDGQRWSIGRIDNDGWYTYGNMKWELDFQQAQNHTQQSNNTSGITGVRRESKVVGNNTYYSWVVSWKPQDSKYSKTKNFSCNKHGEDIAKQMAIDYRESMIALLNSQGAEYADSHGNIK